MRKLFKERKLFKGGNYMRKYGIYQENHPIHLYLIFEKSSLKIFPNIKLDEFDF